MTRALLLALMCALLAGCGGGDPEDQDDRHAERPSTPSCPGDEVCR